MLEPDFIHKATGRDLDLVDVAALKANHFNLKEKVPKIKLNRYYNVFLRLQASCKCCY